MVEFRLGEGMLPPPLPAKTMYYNYYWSQLSELSCCLIGRGRATM